MGDETYIETKRTLDGRLQHFSTRLLLRTPGFVAVRYDFTGTTPVTVSGFVIPPGCYSLGFFWRARTYDLYHIARADGSPVADRFDVIERVRIRRDGVEFTDLLLDLWVGPDGTARFEDEEEVAEARARGLIDDTRYAIIERTARHLRRHHARIIAEALARVGHATPPLRV